MKRSIFTLTVVLLLVLATAPLMAQGQTQPYQDQTNPNAGSISPHSGLTLTGQVVSWNESGVVLKTASGQMTIRINDLTAWPKSLTVGDTVGVDYNRTSQGVMIATQIRPQGSEGMATTSTTATEEDSETATQKKAEAMNEPSEATESAHSDLGETEGSQSADTTDPMNQDTSTNTKSTDTMADYNTGSNLPATGSELPLLGLLGFLSLAGAVALRASR